MRPTGGSGEGSAAISLVTFVRSVARVLELVNPERVGRQKRLITSGPIALVGLLQGVARARVVLQQLVRVELPRAAGPLAAELFLARVDPLVLLDRARVGTAVEQGQVLVHKDYS